MKIRNPKYPWKPSHVWDNCPGCFEQFYLKTCNHCGSGYPDEYVEVKSPPTALGLAREEIAELKRQLEDMTADRNDCLALAKSNFAKILESQAREAWLRAAIQQEINYHFMQAGPKDLPSIKQALALPHDDTALKEYLAANQKEKSNV